MIPLDHDKQRGTPYCPMMGEVCQSGSTKSMKGNKCASWRPLPMTDTKTQMTEKVHACSVFEWPPALAYEQSALLQQNRASADKIASEVNKHHASFIGALGAEARGRLLEADPQPLLDRRGEEP